MSKRTTSNFALTVESQQLYKSQSINLIAKNKINKRVVYINRNKSNIAYNKDRISITKDLATNVALTYVTEVVHRTTVFTNLSSIVLFPTIFSLSLFSQLPNR